MIGHLVCLDKKLLRKNIYTKLMYVQDAFTVQKGHVECTVVQK